MRPSQRAQCVEVGRVTGVVHGQDRAGARRDRCRDLVRVDVERVRLDVHQYGSRADVLDHVYGRRERHWRRDDLVARADPQCFERGVQGCRAGIERQRPRGSQKSRELVLEPLRLRSRGDPLRAERVHNLLDLLLADRRRRERKEVAALGWCRAGGDGAAPWARGPMSEMEMRVARDCVANAGHVRGRSASLTDCGRST